MYISQTKRPQEGLPLHCLLTKNPIKESPLPQQARDQLQMQNLSWQIFSTPVCPSVLVMSQSASQFPALGLAGPSSTRFLVFLVRVLAMSQPLSLSFFLVACMQRGSEQRDPVQGGDRERVSGTTDGGTRQRKRITATTIRAGHP